MKKENIEKTIAIMEDEFDTHKFIEKYIIKYEEEYVELLYSHKLLGKKGIFKAAHSEIGKCLAKSDKLKKLDRSSSENIKKYKTKNQNWRKIS